MKDIIKEKRAFTEEEAAIYISMSRSFLRQDRMNGLRKKRTPGPKYIKKGRFIRYLREDLNEWLETNSAYLSNNVSEDTPSISIAVFLLQPKLQIIACIAFLASLV